MSHFKTSIESIIQKHLGKDLLIVTHASILGEYIGHINSIIETYNRINSSKIPLLETTGLHYLSTLSFSKTDTRISDITLS